MRRLICRFTFCTLLVGVIVFAAANGLPAQDDLEHSCGLRAIAYCEIQLQHHIPVVIGAIFDPAKGGAVVQGPAQTPLASVPIQVHTTTGAITTTQ